MFLRGYPVGLRWVLSPICLCIDTTDTLSTRLPGALSTLLPVLAQPFSAALLQCAQPRHLGPERFLQTNQSILWYFLQPVYIRTRIRKSSSDFSFEVHLAVCGEGCESNGRLPWSHVPPSHILMCPVRERAQLFSLIKNNLWNYPPLYTPQPCS